MAANENVRVNTAFIGFFLLGFVLLMFGVLGLQYGEVFGNYFTDYNNMPIDVSVLNSILIVVALIFFLITIFSYRIGLKNATYFFAFFGIALLAVAYTEENSVNSNWFVYMALAIFSLILAIYLAMNSTPKFITVLAVIMAVIFFFVSLAAYFFLTGPGAGNPETFKAMAITYGIFSFIGFVISTYLGLAVANRKKIPLI